MEIGTPFILNIADEIPENHISDDNIFNDKLPFEFCRSRMWSENFFSPEIGSGHSIASLEKELCEIKQLVTDIKNILKDLFEL